MELYNFVRGSLAWIVTVAAIWPVNVPLAALAYKVRNGPNPIAMRPREFWLRATFAALVTAILAVVMLGIDYLLADGAGLPAGPVHLIMLVAFIPAGMWIMFVFFALEDLMQAVNLLVIYICLPVLVLYVANAIFGFWQPLVDMAEGYLKKPE